MTSLSIDDIVKIEDLPTMDEVRGRAAKKTTRKPAGPRKPRAPKQKQDKEQDAQLLGFTVQSTTANTGRQTPRKRIAENPEEPKTLTPGEKRTQKAKAK